MVRFRFSGFLVLFWTSISLAQSPFSAYQAATIDAKSLSPLDRPFTRYVWVWTGDKDDAKVISFLLNWLSNSAVVWKPLVLGGDKLPMLVRVDLRRYAPDVDSLKRWIKTWEKLSLDPNFSLLITGDSIRVLTETLEGKLPFGIKEVSSKTGKLLIEVPPYTEDGKEWKEKWVTVIRQLLFGGELEALLGTAAPIVQSDYFVIRALGSIRDKGLFAEVFGGEYYGFSGVRSAKEANKKSSDLDVLFQDLGIIDDADGKVKAQDKLDRLGSEQRIAMIHSKVTGKIRAVHILPTLKSVRKKGILFITQDSKDQSIDILQNPFMNLLAYQPDAMEAIWVDANGSQKYALFNQQGQLQDEVPPDVANDNTIPTPYTKRLQAGIGCIICHGHDGKDGWQDLPNEVNLPLKRGLDLKADLSNRKRSTPETLNLIAGKYSGNADETLRDLRRGLIGSVLEMTGPWKDSKEQLDVYKLTALQVEKIRKRYFFTSVDASMGLKELGIDPGEQPIETLRQLLPPDTNSKVDFLSLVPEDIRIGQMLAGKAIPRIQWELVKGFVQGRIHKQPIKEKK